MSQETAPVVDQQAVSETEQLQLGEPSQEEAVPQDAETAFDEHVALVRAEGDAADARVSLRPSVIGARALAASAIVGPALNMEAPIGRIATVLIAAGATTLYATSRNQYHDVKIADRRMGADTQAALGQHYELYRMPSSRRLPEGRVGLYWAGPMDTDADEPPALDKQLEQMAERAKRAGVDVMAVPKELSDVLDPGLHPKSSRTSVYAWIKAFEGVRTSRKEKEYELTVNSPDGWLTTLKHIRRTEGTDAVSVLIDKLEQLDPSHPLARIGRAYAADSEFRDERLRVFTRRGLEDRRLIETEMSLLCGQKVVGMVHHSPKSMKAHSEGRIKGANQVDRVVAGVFQHTEALDQALGLDQATLKRVLEDPEQDRQLATRVFEYLLHKRLAGGPSEEVDELVGMVTARQAGGEASAGVDFKPLEMQKYLVRPFEAGWRPISRSQQTRRHWAAGALTSVLGLVGFGSLDVVLEDRYDAAAYQARQQLAREQGVTADQFVTQADVERRVGATSLELGAWRRLDKIRDGLDDFTDIGPKPPGIIDRQRQVDGAASSGGASYVGDIYPGTPNRIDWVVEGYNMSTEGYWAAGTSATLRLEESHKDGLLLSWVREGQTYREYDVPTSIFGYKADYNGMRIAVSRSIGINEYLQLDPKKEGNLVLAIPVLDGTKPVSVALDGQPVKLLYKDDGTFAIRTPDGQPLSGHLTYDLVPATKGTGPHARSAFSTEGNMDVNESAMDGYWQTLIPGLPDHRDPDRRTQMITEYIQQNFTYALAPLEADPRIYNGLDFTHVVNTRKQANCNVAASLLLLENPWLSVADGYLNRGGKGSGILSTHEAHAWAVNGRGERYDASPWRGISSEDAAYFDEGALLEPPRQLPDQLPLLPLVGLTGALALAVAQRRRLLAGGQAVFNVPANHAQRQLERSDVAALRTARELAEQAVYAPTGRALRVDAALGRAQAAKTTAADEIAKLRRPDMHSAQARQALHQARKHAAGNHKAAIRAAQQTLSRGRRAARRR